MIFQCLNSTCLRINTFAFFFSPVCLFFLLKFFLNTFVSILFFAHSKIESFKTFFCIIDVNLMIVNANMSSAFERIYRLNFLLADLGIYIWICFQFLAIIIPQNPYIFFSNLSNCLPINMSLWTFSFSVCIDFIS